MKIEKTTTGLIIREPSDFIKSKCLEYFTLKNPVREFFIYSGNDEDNKSIFGGERDVIYITSGFAKIKNNSLQNELRNIHEIQPQMGKHVDIKMNREPRSDLQRDCIKMMTTSTANKLTVELKPGTGKALPYSTLIPTPNICDKYPTGIIPLCELKKGDKVFSRDGYPTEIAGVYEQGIRDVYTVTFEDGRKVDCDIEHLWTVKVNDNPYEIITLREMINILETSNNSSLYIPICKPVKYKKLNHTSKDNMTSDNTISNEYMFSDIEDRIRIIEDIIGSLDDGEYHSTNTSLLKQLSSILYSLGYSVKFNNVNNISFKKIYAEGLKITDISYSRQENCRCILVDNPEHVFLVNDYIVTHNTFISLYSIAKIGLKPLIVTPSTLLKNQWIENLTDLSIDKNDIATNIYDAPNKTFCVVTISSLENAIRDDWNGLLKVIDKAQFGIKITDESHLHLKGLLKLDAICNIKHNWYLSATLGRSDASEDKILNRALLDAERFVGNSNYEEYQKEYVNIYLQDIFYHPSRGLCDEMFRYGTKGLVRSSYYNMLMRYKGGIPFISNIISMIKRVKTIVPPGKILILVPLIETIKTTLKYIKQDPYFNKYSCVGVDGSMSISEKRKALESDIIISTSMSMGVGVDISNLISVINFDQYASPIITEQIAGRLRDRGQETFYIDICDHVKYAKTIENWGRKRRILLPYFPGTNPNVKYLPNIRC